MCLGALGQSLVEVVLWVDTLVVCFEVLCAFVHHLGACLEGSVCPPFNPGWGCCASVQLTSSLSSASVSGVDLFVGVVLVVDRLSRHGIASCDSMNTTLCDITMDLRHLFQHW